MATQKNYFADEIGALKLKQEPRKQMLAGDVGYLITGVKEAKEVKVGDTITSLANPTANAIGGFEEVKPMVFAGIYPVDTKIKAMYFDNSVQEVKKSIMGALTLYLDFINLFIMLIKHFGQRRHCLKISHCG